MREEWKHEKLKNVCVIRPPKKEAKESIDDDELVSFVPMDKLGINQMYFGSDDCRPLKSVYSGYTYFKDGDVILAKITPCFENGKLGIAKGLNNGIGFGSSEYVVYRPIENLDKRFLYYFLSRTSFKEKGKHLMGGAVGHQRIPKDFYEEEKIPIPPITEQKQIVALLDQAFAAIDQAKANIEKNIENAKELFQSKLNNIFSQKGDGWEEKSLGELGKPSMCKRILKEQTKTEGDIPFYKIGTFGKTPNAFISNEIYEEYKTKYSFPKIGDVLISASGTIGRRVIYDGEPAFFQDSNIVWIDNNEEFVINEYLYQFYGVCDWNPSKGATISRLYNADLKRIKISFPDKAKQKELVELMVNLNCKTQAIAKNYGQKLYDLDELKKSILQKAFAGELTGKEMVV